MTNKKRIKMINEFIKHTADKETLTFPVERIQEL